MMNFYCCTTTVLLSFFFAVQVAISETLTQMNDVGEIFHQGLKISFFFRFFQFLFFQERFLLSFFWGILMWFEQQSDRWSCKKFLIRISPTTFRRAQVNENHENHAGVRSINIVVILSNVHYNISSLFSNLNTNPPGGKTKYVCVTS